ncbi:MAG: Proline-tRNA ligase [Candidatus Kuenenbacteria bacterium GW2011_GWA2_42_15]|uniref:Proline--tRNA ligase n=2 Tax=Candidatus Kueneniibacteriota TaxID=1752740 RepID=A0A0G0YUP7_9BACT|nr:MAG: Proline-tRNA ligase [Candidatus Kuenenbacteria bacterium GW2011_GWA2_42_15]
MSKLTPQSTDFSKWYNEIVLASGLADYSDVKGCMIIKPYGYALWENIQKVMDEKIKELGVDNVYLPLLIPESYFEKEKEHVKGFAPEVAWVTHAGGKKLDERLAIRPTSETIMYRTFARWIASYRDLPLKVNQWANVIRWEMRTRLFLRTTEFLWQEGHTLHETKEQADEMVQNALYMYKTFARDYLAMAVIDGRKSESEKFAGAEYTTSIEAMMKDKKALQLGTSHLLAQNFAKSFEVKFLDKEGKEQTPWPTSWGVSTRMIGGLIMAHGDDKGLIIPPNIAPIQVIIVPIWKDNSEKKIVKNYIEKLKEKLQGLKYKIDWDDGKSPGWKFNEWEMKGVPLRVEVGPKDEASNQIIAVRRDTGEKIKVNFKEAGNKIKELIEEIQRNLLEKNAKFLKENTREYSDYNKFKQDINKENFFALVNWCGDAKCEDKVKNDTKATTRVCLQAEQNHGEKKCLFIRCLQGWARRFFMTIGLKVLPAKNYKMLICSVCLTA